MTRISLSCLRNMLCAAVAFFCFAGIGVPGWAQFEARAGRVVAGAAGGSNIAIGDFNHHGKPDLAVTGDNLSILLGNGDGTFRSPITYSGVFYSIAAADFNGDGNLDLVVTPDSNNVSVFLGNGDGTFQLPINSPMTGPGAFIAVGDFNGDHKMDIAVVNNPYISVLLGNGDGTFQTPINNDSFVGAHQLAVGDFNDDHLLDVAVVGYFGGTPNFGILLGNGDGTLQDSLTYPLNYTPGSVAAADFRRDGKLDLAIGPYLGDDVAVLIGNGDGSFQHEVDYPITEGGDVLVKDFNRDGNLDIVSGLTLLLGNGDGTFRSPVKSGVPSGGVVSDGLEAVGDLNGDGMPDLVLLGGETVTSMLNTGALSFSPTVPLKLGICLVDTDSAPQTVTLTNTGATAIPITSIKVSGEFQVSSTCGNSLAVGASCAISAVFQPTAVGHQTGLVTLIDGASSKPQFIELSGTGTIIRVSPASLTFAKRRVGTKSSPQIVTATNEGGTALMYGSITIGGADAHDFSETDNCAGRSIPPGGGCELKVTFSPTKAGTRSAGLYLHPIGTVGPQPVRLSGTGD